MTAAYVPVKGDRVRCRLPGSYVYTVTAVGEAYFLARGSSEIKEYSLVLDENWIKVETPTPLPERWVNLYPSHMDACYVGRTAAERHAMSSCLAVLHIWTDADGVDHAEIERVAP